MPDKENLVPPKHDGCGTVWLGGKEHEDIPGTDLRGSVNSLCDSKLRAELKLQYYRAKRYTHGIDLKSIWYSDAWMFTIKDQTPVMRPPALLCNKSTTLYWDVSAQQPGGVNVCPIIIFACIYKCWFRYHNNDPDMKFGKFFAYPSRITQTGPHTIPEILKAHVYLCDRAASDLESIKSGPESDLNKRSYWENFHLLPLSRAIIVLLDECFTWPFLKEDGTMSLDDEMQRRTVVLVLTGYNQGLKSGDLNFDSIRSSALPLARDDTDDDSKNFIRVPLKTAVHFIEQLQQREERADLNLTSESAPKDRGSTMRTEEEADAHVEDILANASTDPVKARKLKSATEVVRLIDSGLMRPDLEFTDFWSQRYI